MPRTNARLMRFDFRLYGSYLLNAGLAMVAFVTLHGLYDIVRTSSPRPAIASFAALVSVSLLAGLAAGLAVARTFRMSRFLQWPPHRPPQTAWQSVDQTTKLRGTDVLIVDDQEQQLKLLSEALRDVGARVRTASTIEEAAEAVEERSPDVLVSDLILRPGDDLHILLAKLDIGARPSRSSTLRIAVSAYPEVIDEGKVEALGFDAYLPRPFTAEQLAALINARLKGSPVNAGA